LFNVSRTTAQIERMGLLLKIEAADYSVYLVRTCCYHILSGLIARWHYC